MKPIIYGFVAVVIATVVIISYLYMIQIGETYNALNTDGTINLIVVDENGNMTTAAVRPPSLVGIRSNILYVDSSGNIGLISAGDVYTSYQGGSSNNLRNLLTIDANNNFSVISSHKFSPCQINGDPNTNPNATINGIPNSDGTCKCRNSWKGNSCSFCDGAGPDCIWSNDSLCGGKGKLNDNKQCICNPGYAGNSCQFDGNQICGEGGTITTLDTGWFKCLNCGDNRDLSTNCLQCNPGWKREFIGEYLQKFRCVRA